MLLSVINIVLSPVNLLFFVFFASTKSNSDRYFENAGTNVSRLKIAPYLLYNLSFVASVLLITYGVVFFMADDLVFWEVYQPRYYWLSITGWIVTLLTLKVYFKGMEGNIMGFIFFPMLLFASAALGIANIASLFSFSINLDLPGLNLGFWTRFLVHAFLPFYIILFINHENNQGDKSTNIITPLTGSLIFQLIFFGLNWVIVKIFGTSLSFSYFFGDGQSLLYYIPMMGGALYYLMYFLSQFESLAKRKWKETLDMGTMIVASIMVLLQLFNYLKLIRNCF